MRRLTEGYVPAYMAGWNECVDEYKCLLDEANERIAELEAKIHEATEAYAGMEGFIPETAAEGYCLRIIRQMYSALIGGEDE